MATFTSRIRLEKQDNGANSGTWGTVLNQNVIDLVDDAVAGYTIVSCSSAITLSSNKYHLFFCSKSVIADTV